MVQLRAYAASTVLLYALACTTTPTEPEFDNPIIPEDPNYKPPLTILTSGPAEGAVIDSHAVTFSWAGNVVDMEFTYRLDDRDWSGWEFIDTFTFQYLDEGDYTFEVKGRYLSGVEEQSAKSRSFNIDDIHGPALWLKPRHQTVVQGGGVTVELMLEDVADVLAAKAVLSFDPSQFQVTVIDLYEDDRSLLKSNGGTVIPFSSFDNTTGTITIDLATSTGSPAGVTGTGAIAEITLIASRSGQITFGTSSSLRDVSNHVITISEKVEAAVGVQ